MRVVEDSTQLPKPSGKRAFVPSLGNLHRGHLSLIEAARKIGDEVVVSIFVNPTQFRAGEDFDRYPRTPQEDLGLCEAAGVNYVFMPTVETMYPDGLDALSIHLGDVGDQWEGLVRPGHFDGVATVVAKLLLHVRPHCAIFGQKDLQQNAVVRRLLTGLNLGVELIIEPTIREADGLALSSRNAYLSEDERRIAPQLYQALCEGRDELLSDANQNVDKLLSSIGTQLDAQFSVQYFALVNRNSMKPTHASDDEGALITAALLGTTRLIDNVPLY